jgi:hypothetical protein
MDHKSVAVLVDDDGVVAVSVVVEEHLYHPEVIGANNASEGRGRRSWKREPKFPDVLFAPDYLTTSSW